MSLLSGGQMLKVGSTGSSLGGPVRSQTGSGQVEPREKPLSTPESAADLAVTSMQGPTEVALHRRPLAEVETATEPECTPRSTGSSSLVSAAVGSESSTASHTMLANQVPPLVAFSGEEKDGITFRDWHEQLELVAGLCGWSDHVKLVNVATRLKEVAYAFYCSCTATQRATYQQMMYCTILVVLAPVLVFTVATPTYVHARQSDHISSLQVTQTRML